MKKLNDFRKILFKYLGAFHTINCLDGSKGKVSTDPWQFMETYRFRFIKGKTFCSLSQTWSRGEMWCSGKGDVFA